MRRGGKKKRRQRLSGVCTVVEQGNRERERVRGREGGGKQGWREGGEKEAAPARCTSTGKLAHLR